MKSDVLSVLGEYEVRDVKIHVCMDGKFFAWIGGCLLGMPSQPTSHPPARRPQRRRGNHEQ